MTGDSHLSVRRSVAAVAAVVLLMAGAGATYFLMRTDRGAVSQETPDPGHTPAAAGGLQSQRGDAGDAPRQPPAPASQHAEDASLPDVVVTLTPEAVKRAGIAVAPVSRARPAAAIRLPGVVEPNAYRQVAVTPLVSGRVSRVSAELGDQVRRGQTLAQIFSPELAEAQTRYIAARAELEAHDRELQRTQKLVEIGAASRQELERIHAQHAAQTAGVQSARSRLELLGMPAAAIDDLAAGKDVGATANVPAPIGGTITERLANIGLNVDPATRLFTVVDLSTVWVLAELYERDFSRVRVGSEATITTTAYPDRALEGRVSYIDPQLDPETRTAQVRIEVPNPRGELRLGMYADVRLDAAAGAPVPVVPRSAVQNVGDRAVVYVASPDEPAQFIEREIRVGQASGEQLEVLAGVSPGDMIVTDGSFFLRAERERLGLRPPGADSAATRPPASAPATLGADVQEARVIVGEQGYEPARLSLRAATPARITFVRTTDKTCGTEVVFPSLDIKRALPLNAPVTIEFTPRQDGEITFTCGMDMLRGSIRVIGL